MHIFKEGKRTILPFKLKGFYYEPIELKRYISYELVRKDLCNVFAMYFWRLDFSLLR